MTSRPPFHADQVGSLLRPAELREARERYRKGALDAPGLRTARVVEVARQVWQ